MLAADVRTRRHGTRGTFVRVEVVDVARGCPAGRLSTIPRRPAKCAWVGRPPSLDAALAACTPYAASRRARFGWTLDDSPGWGAPLADSLAALRGAGLDAVASARLDRLELDRGLRAVARRRTPAAVGHARHARRRRRAARSTRGAPCMAGSDRCGTRLCAAGGRDLAEQPTTGYDDMRHVALARWCSTTSRTSRRTGRGWARSCRRRACCSAPTTSTPCPRATTCRTGRAARSRGSASQLRGRLARGRRARRRLRGASPA